MIFFNIDMAVFGNICHMPYADNVGADQPGNVQSDELHLLLMSQCYPI